MRTGERSIEKPNGDEIAVLYTSRSIANAEKLMGRGILEVLNAFSEGKSGFSDVAILLQSGMEGARRVLGTGGRRVTQEIAHDLIDEIGFLQVATPVFEALAEAISYNSAESDEDSEKN